MFSQALRLCQRAGLFKRATPGPSTVTLLLEQAQQTDRDEDERYGNGRSGDEIPPELADAEMRLRRIREAEQALARGRRALSTPCGEPSSNRYSPKSKRSAGCIASVSAACRSYSVTDRRRNRADDFPAYLLAPRRAKSPKQSLPTAPRRKQLEALVGPNQDSVGSRGSLRQPLRLSRYLPDWSGSSSGNAAALPPTEPL